MFSLSFVDYLFENHYKLVGYGNVRNIKTNKIVSLKQVFVKYWYNRIENYE